MILRTVLPAQTAGGATSVTLAGVYEPGGFTTNTITKILVISPTAVTGAATNNFTLNVRQLRAGVLVNTLATKTFAAGSNLAVEVPLALTIAKQPNMAADDVVDVQLVQAGTGLAVPVGIVVQVHIG